MKIDPHLPKLPSVSELLADPRVKRVVDRIHQSTVAQRAGSFLEELRAAIADRARHAGWTDAPFGGSDWPSLGQLAERFARRILGSAPEGVAFINATGVVLRQDDYAVPLPESAIHALLAQAGDYALHEQQSLALGTDLAMLAASDEGLVVSSYESALLLLMASLGAGAEVVIVGQGAGFEDAVDWQSLGRFAGVTVRFAQASAALRDEVTRGAKLWIVEAGAGDVSSGEQSVEWPDSELLSAIAREAASRAIRTVFAASMAGVVDPSDFGYASIPTLAQRLSSGVNGVVTAGDGLLGGPSLGVVVGDADLVGAARGHALARLTAASPLAVAALSASLAHYGTPRNFQHMTPVWQLLTAPLENLRNRCERLAPLLAVHRDAAEATPREVMSSWLQWGRLNSYGPSWAIAIRPRMGMGAHDFAAQLRRLPVPIHVGVAGEEVLLDLRSVFPRWDHQLEEMWSRSGETLAGASS